MENGTYQAYKEQELFYSFYAYLYRSTKIMLRKEEYVPKEELDVLYIQVIRGAINDNASYCLLYDTSYMGNKLRTYYYVWSLMRKIMRQFANMENISISKMFDRLDVGYKVEGEYEVPTDYNHLLISESLEQIYKIIESNREMFYIEFRDVLLEKLLPLIQEADFYSEDEVPLYISVKKPAFPTEEDIAKIHSITKKLKQELEMMKEYLKEAMIYAVYNKKCIDLDLFVATDRKLDDAIYELKILNNELSYNLLSYESTILTSPNSAEELREFLSTLINPFCKNKDEIEETEYELLRLYEEDGHIIFSPIEEKEFEEKFNKLIQRILVNSYKIGEFASKARE